MISDYERVVLAAAHDAWGDKAQLLMVAEECSELSAAVLRALRDRPGSRQALLEEAADVGIMLDQLPLLFGSGAAEEIARMRGAKVRRLAIRLGCELAGGKG